MQSEAVRQLQDRCDTKARQVQLATDLQTVDHGYVDGGD
jgi:hypothetical protein